MRDRALTAVLAVVDVPAHVGDYMGEARIDDVTVLRFASLHPGYPGWYWSVAMVGEADAATINEVWMEPGEGALPLPVWKPWSERVRPGDLGAGDVVPTAADDVRLTPGYTGEGDDAEELRPEQWQPGLGRERVLSVLGLADAADRWRSGEDGPDSQVARLADAQCSSCGWLLPIGGLLGQAFGVCAHDMSPSDGHIVALDHGCGAHSDVKVDSAPIPVTELIVDDEAYVRVERDTLPEVEGEAGSEVVAEAEVEAEGGEVAADESAVQPLAPTDDVPNAEQADDDTGEGDVTPPQGVTADQDVVEDDGEQGE